jgi:tRNA wybutosine-synthesizing protein 1
MDGEGSFSHEPVLLEHLKLGASAKSKFLTQGYRLIGEEGHGAVKLCHWTKSALRGGPACYKHDFYGIDSHRCVQMTPSLPSCNYACNFCWRDHFGNKPTLDGFKLDSPGDLFAGALDAQKILVTGYKGNPKVAYEHWLEAREPRHIAISLNGEPTNYPHIDELFGLATERGITTFLVTNGSNPHVLKGFRHWPTQIYLSVDASNERMFHEICNPLLPNLWERFQETVSFFGSLPTRTVCRNTLVKGWNMEAVDEYADLLRRANPMFIESKGYSHMGASMARLSRENMPSHEEILAWSRALVERLPGYELVNERADSRVTLLSRVGRETRIPQLGPALSGPRLDMAPA